MLVQYAPTGDVAKSLWFTVDQALCIDGTDTTHDLSIISQHKSVVGLLYPPVLPESTGPLIGGTHVTQVPGEKQAKILKITVFDRFNRWLVHFFQVV